MAAQSTYRNIQDRVLDTLGKSDATTRNRVKNLLPNPYSIRVNKDGTRTGYSMCRSCNTDRLSKYRKTPKGKIATRKAVKGSIAKHKGKQVARMKVYNAIKTGVLVRPMDCGKCNKSASRIDAHHTDYATPLEVQWLCRSCHATLHRV